MSFWDWFDYDDGQSWQDTAVEGFMDGDSGEYNLAGSSGWDYDIDNAFQVDVSDPVVEDGGWLNDALSATGNFLTSDKGMGLLAGAGSMGLKYLQADQQQEFAMEQMRKKHEMEMELLNLKSALSSGRGGGSGGGTNQYSHNEGITALAKKYPSNPNFKRNT